MCIACKDDYVFSTNIKFECRPACSANFTRVAYGTAIGETVLTTLRKDSK